MDYLSYMKKIKGAVSNTKNETAQVIKMNV